MAGKYNKMFATHTSTHMPSCTTLMSPRCRGCAVMGAPSWVRRCGFAVVGAPEQGSLPKAGFPASYCNGKTSNLMRQILTWTHFYACGTCPM